MELVIELANGGRATVAVCQSRINAKNNPGSKPLFDCGVGFAKYRG
ncbi:hypothetical protein D1AOALGA4SA_11189 [Olavius algarvensis Delta 1 endosymbiont]|nr:hypothetical protein D1AOALGA4SA_11189 [Olavius algarvensis Delta 1 endosymbiont]